MPRAPPLRTLVAMAAQRAGRAGVSVETRVRASLEAREAALAPGAAREATSRGRERPEPPSALRVAYQLDRDRIIHTRAFRRLTHKTQVFIAPDSDHVVTRMTHTIEVQQIARTIARALGLNEDLAEAIALGHDLGHTPFGHAGEEMLASLLPEGFRHNEQSLRIVDRLENAGRGLNLSAETREGSLMHSKVRESVAAEAWGTAATLEGQIVKLADSSAYLNHDIEDAIRAGLITPSELPDRAVATLGETRSHRLDRLVRDCVANSWEAAQDPPGGEGPAGRITLSEEALEATDTLRDFMFERVYLVDGQLDRAQRGQRVLEALFRHYEAHPREIPGYALRGDPPWRRAADYVSGMTDGYAIRRAHDLGLESAADWRVTERA